MRVSNNRSWLSSFSLALVLIVPILVMVSCAPSPQPATPQAEATPVDIPTALAEDSEGGEGSELATPAETKDESEGDADLAADASAAEETAATEAPLQDGAGSGEDVGAVSVESARSLPEVVGEDDPWFASLSPDGTYLAYYTESGRGRDRTGNICLYTFNSAAKSCHELSSDLFLGYPYQLQWSADSNRVAFSENPAEFGYDSDIWLFNVADDSFANLTDDGYVGSWRQETGTPSPNVDYLPAWNPTDGQIYFWRFVSQGEYLNFNLGIYRVSPEGGEAELVRDLTDSVPQAVPVFKQEEFFLDGPSAVSPDGQSVAVLLTTLDEFGGTQVSLWLISLADAGAAPQEWMTSSSFNAALPAWQQYPAYPTGLSWTADGQGVLTIAQSQSTHTPFTLFYYVDAESGSIAPVVDFSGLPDPESYFESAPGSAILYRYYSPWSGSLSPQGNKLLMVNDLGGVTGLLTAPLPPEGDLPLVSAAVDESIMSTASRSSRSEDGKVLVYGLLLTVTE